MSDFAAAPGVIVLAGGFGTRVSHLLPGVPKPMAPVEGRPFVEWIVRYFTRWGCRNFILATGHLSEVVESHFQSQPVPGARVTCRVESTPLGTAGGCLNAMSGLPPRKDGLWLVVNGDSLVFADPRPLFVAVRNAAAPAEPLKKGSPSAAAGPVDAAVLGLSLDDAGRFGSLEIADDGTLRSFREKRPGPGVINAGVYAFTDACLRGLPARRPLSFEFDVFPALAAARRVRAVTTIAPFLDIGTPATLTQAARFIAAHREHFP